MTAEQLKNSILKLAVTGKLVPQNPSEGTGEQLYRQIQVEKAKLLSEGKIKKGKPLSEITEDEIPFEIPETWKWCRLEDVIITCFSGKNPKYSDAENTNFCIGQKNNQEYGIDLTGIKYVTDNYWNSIPNDLFLKKGDVLINTLGTGTMGRSGIWSGEVEEAICDSCVLVLRTNNRFLSSYILAFSRLNRHDFERLATGTTNQKSINKKEILNYPIPIPPLEEQKRIVAKLEELKLLISRYEDVWTALDTFNKRFPADMQKSILQMAIQGKLVPQNPSEGTGEQLYRQIQSEKAKLLSEGKIKKGKPLSEITEDEIPFEIPETWKWVRFNNICSVLTCGYASTPHYVSKEEGMPFISAKNVKPYRFMPENHNYISQDLYHKLVQNAKPEKGDILLTRVGAGIGEAAIIDTDLDFAIYVSLTLIKLVSNNLISNKYVLYWLNSPIGVASAKKNIYGKNASQGNLNVKNVRDFLVPLPPFDEQMRIVAKLEELLPICERLKSQQHR